MERDALASGLKFLAMPIVPPVSFVCLSVADIERIRFLYCRRPRLWEPVRSSPVGITVVHWQRPAPEAHAS